MFQRIYLAILYKIYLFYLKITGFWPFEYDTRYRRFKFNSFYLIMPLFFVPYILTNYVLHSSLLLDEVKALFKNIVLKMVSNVYISSNVFYLVFLCITQTLQWKRIQQLIYRTTNLYENLCRCVPLDDINYLSHLIKFTIKSLVFPIIIVCYMIFSMTVIAPDAVKLYMLPGFVTPVFLNKFYPDIHYGGMLLVDFYLIKINKDLKTILLNVTRTEKELGDITDRLDTISINYVELIEIVNEFNQIMSFRVVLWILLGLLNFLIHLFMEYVFIGIPIRYGHSLNITISASGVLDLLYQFLEFWTTSSICSSVLKKVDQTETILSSIYVQFVDNDGPLIRSIEMFLCRIKHYNLQITGCGLFSLDSTLIYSIVCTSTSYLIILIQFELAM